MKCIRVFWQWYAVLRLAMGSILYLKRRRSITANGCHPNSCRPGLKAVLVIISDSCRYQMNATWLQRPLQQVAFICFKFDCYVQVLIIVDLLIEPVLISRCNFRHPWCHPTPTTGAWPAGIFLEYPHPACHHAPHKCQHFRQLGSTNIYN